MNELRFLTDGVGLIAAFNLFLTLLLHPALSWASRRAGFWETVEDNIFDSFSDFVGAVSSMAFLVLALLFHVNILNF